MKKNKLIFFLTLATLLIYFKANAQITPEKLVNYISEKPYINNAGVYDIYSRLNYSTVWLQNNNRTNRDIFLNALKQADNFGLSEKDYQYAYLNSFQTNTFQLKNMEDSLEAEIRFTDAALHFYNDLAYGNTKPALAYNGLKYTAACYNIPELLSGHLSSNRLQLLHQLVAGNQPETEIILHKLKWLNDRSRMVDFKEVTITAKTITNSNIPLIIKLFQLGITDKLNFNITDSMLKIKIKEAQVQFNLLQDGKLNPALMHELNIPISTRKQQLHLSVNYYRWINCLTREQSTIVVNIPAAYLKVYFNGGVLLEMRMVVGKKTTPTPTLSSTINEVILYPYWHVPKSIATKELLPIIKRNPGYINKGNYQVLNSAGMITDPYTVDWNALSTGYFPYTIRQSTGCDNALGLIKLNFYNPFSVYLHDTNSKNIFKYNRRYLSHGCMRLQKPIELAHLILKHNALAIDTLEQQGCLRNQSPITVSANEKMPVIVWYNPAGIDSTGRVLYYEDVYKKFNWQNK